MEKFFSKKASQIVSLIFLLLYLKRVFELRNIETEFGSPASSKSFMLGTLIAYSIIPIVFWVITYLLNPKTFFSPPRPISSQPPSFSLPKIKQETKFYIAVCIIAICISVAVYFYLKVTEQNSFEREWILFISIAIAPIIPLYIYAKNNNPNK